MVSDMDHGWGKNKMRTLRLIVAMFMTGLTLMAPMPTIAAAPGAANLPPPPIRIVAYGDSLTAGFGVGPAESFPVQLYQALAKKGYNVEVINAGVSGDTTAAALERFDWAVPDGVHAAIVVLGGNDALRGQDPQLAKRNLDAIITRLKAKGVEVLLGGMPAPRNWGDAYVKSFDGMFEELSSKHAIPLYPFFLDGVVLDPKLNQADGIHPNPKGVAVIVERILPAVMALIAKVEDKRRAPVK
jgi:acyl-CoA thioesterase I